MSAQFTTKVVMHGSGLKYIEVPKGYKYVSIINNTPDTVMLFTGQQVYEGYDPKDAIISVTPRTSITIPLGEYTSYFTVIYRKGIVGDDPQTVQLIFSVVNLNINTQLGTPGNTNNVVITSDGAGLAKQNQLPSTLEPDGSLKTSVKNPLEISRIPDMGIKSGQSVGVTSIPDMGIKEGQVVSVKNQITGFATSSGQDSIFNSMAKEVKQDTIIASLSLKATTAKQDLMITSLNNINSSLQSLITSQNETNTKLQTLIDQGTSPTD